MKIYGYRWIWTLWGFSSGWNCYWIKVLNSWSTKLGLGVEVLCVKVSFSFTLLNKYIPTQNRKEFLEAFFVKSLILLNTLILGGDFNFPSGSLESWGKREVQDPLVHFFTIKLPLLVPSLFFFFFLGGWRSKCHFGWGKIEKKMWWMLGG